MTIEDDRALLETIFSEESDKTYWNKEFTDLSADEGLNPEVEPLPGDEYLEQAWLEEPLEPTPQIKVPECVFDMLEFHGVIDGGYLSFVYGSRHSQFGGWFNIKWKYKNFLMVMDSKESVRRDNFPDYKSRRNDRRANYPEALETYRRVLEFRTILREDASVRTIELEGYEADDIIALLFINGIGVDRVIAQDKDFFQVPGMKPRMFDHAGICQDYRDFKLPKYAFEPVSPQTYALTQAIFGDKSDSIPRLMPSKGWDSKRLYGDLIGNANTVAVAFMNCYSYFGDDFITNLGLILLPHPSMSYEPYSTRPDLLILDVSDGSYWDKSNFDERFLQNIVNNINFTDEWE